MADTRVQLEVEDWVRQQWMPTQFRQNFFIEIIGSGLLHPHLPSRDQDLGIVSHRPPAPEALVGG